jgi:hypothetical protein
MRRKRIFTDAVLALIPTLVGRTPPAEIAECVAAY